MPSLPKFDMYKDKPNKIVTPGRAKEAPKSEKPKTPWRPKAGASGPRLKEKEKEVVANICPHCEKSVEPGFAICPHCGRSLIPDKCSFCGAPMKPGAKFCSKCGQNRNGVVCPQCHTLNARNFCRKCNFPLTPNGQLALEAAKSDPRFKAVQAYAEELAELHERIVELRHGGPSAKPQELSEADKALLDEYAQLLQAIGSGSLQPKASRKKSKPAEAPQPEYADTTVSLDEIMEAYRQKAEEMNRALAEMVPPVDFTPEQQRDYFAARKIASVKTQYDMSDYSPTMWKCNFCGALHHTPSGCARPELGGTWQYVSEEEYVDKYKDYIGSTTTFVIE